MCFKARANGIVLVTGMSCSVLVWSSALKTDTFSVYMLYPHCTGLWLISLNCDLAPILGSLLPVADVVAVYHMIVLKGYWHSPLEGDAGRGG